MVSKYRKRVKRLEQSMGSAEDVPIFAVFPTKGKPYIRTRQGRKAGLAEFPGVVVKAYVGGISPDDWNEMDGAE